MSEQIYKIDVGPKRSQNTETSTGRAGAEDPNGAAVESLLQSHKCRTISKKRSAFVC